MRVFGHSVHVGATWNPEIDSGLEMMQDGSDKTELGKTLSWWSLVLTLPAAGEYEYCHAIQLLAFCGRICFFLWHWYE